MTYTLYSMQSSGNCYKPRLLMHQLGLPFRAGRDRSRARRDAHAGIPGAEPQRPGAAAGAARRAPPVGIERHAALPRRGHALSPRRPLPAGARPPVAVLRAVRPRAGDRRRALVDEDLSGPHRQGDAGADRRLAEARQRGRSASWSRRWTRATGSAGDAYSVADIALYAYTHVAEDGGFDLAAYPAIERLAETGRGRARPCADGLATLKPRTPARHISPPVT